MSIFMFKTICIHEGCQPNLNFRLGSNARTEGTVLCGKEKLKEPLVCINVINRVCFVRKTLKVALIQQMKGGENIEFKVASVESCD